MSKNKKSLQDLTLLDRFLFAEVMEDPKTFENILSIILGEDISIKGRPQSEHENRTSPLKRQVRLDVWAEDETDAVYNIEAQKAAQKFWNIVMEFTNGDMSLLPELMKFNDQLDEQNEWTKKQRIANDYIQPALEIYFQNAGVDPFKEQ